MRALITGATGFIGKALALELLDRGWDVRLLLRNSLKPLPERLQRCQIFYHDFDRGEATDLRAAVDNCNLVFHSAAIRNHWGASLQAYHNVNVGGTSHLLQASLGRVARFVYISSVGVLGYPGVLNIDETFPIIADSSSGDYHISKVAAERVLRDHSHEIETVIVRPTITYGPGDESGMVTRLIELISERRFIRIGRGRNSIHLSYIDDLIQGLCLAGIHPAAVGQTFILAGPQPVQIYQLINQIESLLRIKLPGLYIPAFVAGSIGTFLEELYRFAAGLSLIDRKKAPPVTRQMVRTFCANRSFSSQKAMKLINYRPRVELEGGLANTIDWLKSINRLIDFPKALRYP